MTLAYRDDFAARISRAGQRRPGTKERIYRAALELFARQGYASTSLRQLAQEVGVEAGSLYNHISSKEELLFDMVQFATRELIAYVEDETERAADEPDARLWAATKAHAVFHCVNRQQAEVGNNELRRLSQSRLSEAMVLRRRYEQHFKALVRAGIEARHFRELDVTLHCLAILAIGTSPSRWFNVEGRLTPDQIGDVYADMVLRATVTPERYLAVFRAGGSRDDGFGGGGRHGGA